MEMSSAAVAGSGERWQDGSAERCLLAEGCSSKASLGSLLGVDGVAFLHPGLGTDMVEVRRLVFLEK